MGFEKAIMDIAAQYGVEAFEKPFFVYSSLRDSLRGDYGNRRLADLYFRMEKELGLFGSLKQFGIKRTRKTALDYAKKQGFKSQDEVSLVTDALSRVLCGEARKPKPPRSSIPKRKEPSLERKLWLWVHGFSKVDSVLIRGECRYLKIKIGKEDYPKLVDEKGWSQIASLAKKRGRAMEVSFHDPKQGYHLYLPNKLYEDLNVALGNADLSIDLKEGAPCGFVQIDMKTGTAHLCFDCVSLTIKKGGGHLVYGGRTDALRAEIRGAGDAFLNLAPLSKDGEKRHRVSLWMGNLVYRYKKAHRGGGYVDSIRTRTNEEESLQYLDSIENLRVSLKTRKGAILGFQMDP